MDLSLTWETLGALALAMAALITALSGRQKNNAEASHQLVEAVDHLLPPLNSRIAALEVQVGELTRQVSELRAQNAKLSRGIEVLIAQVKKLGDKPAWEPPADGDN